jgi:integrase
LASVLPVVEVDVVARRVRRGVTRSLRVWQGVERPRAGSDPRLEVWVSAWRVGLGVRPSTRVRYESHLRIHILPRFGRMRLSEISRVELRSWAMWLAERLEPSSVASIVALLSGVLAEAVREGLMAYNPAERLRAVAPGPGGQAVADASSVRALMSGMGSVAELMTLTAAFTGMRWGELAGLHRENVLLAPRRRRGLEAVAHIRIDPVCGALHEISGQLELGPPKTGAGERLVHLPPFLVGMLAAHLDRHPFPYLFTGPRGGWLRRGTFRKGVWLPALADLETVDGTPHELVEAGFTFHGLRHTHKTWMAEDDVPPSLQDYRLGHRPRGVQGRYEHPTPVMVERLLARLQERWESSASDDGNMRRGDRADVNVGAPGGGGVPGTDAGSGLASESAQDVAAGTRPPAGRSRCASAGSVVCGVVHRRMPRADAQHGKSFGR